MPKRSRADVEEEDREILQAHPEEEADNLDDVNAKKSKTEESGANSAAPKKKGGFRKSKAKIAGKSPEELAQEMNEKGLSAEDVKDVTGGAEEANTMTSTTTTVTTTAPKKKGGFRKSKAKIAGKSPEELAQEMNEKGLSAEDVKDVTGSESKNTNTTMTTTTTAPKKKGGFRKSKAKVAGKTPEELAQEMNEKGLTVEDVRKDLGGQESGSNTNTTTTTSTTTTVNDEEAAPKKKKATARFGRKGVLNKDIDDDDH